MEFTSHGRLMTCYVIWRSRQWEYKLTACVAGKIQFSLELENIRAYLLYFALALRPRDEIFVLLLVVCLSALCVKN